MGRRKYYTYRARRRRRIRTVIGCIITAVLSAAAMIYVKTAGIDLMALLAPVGEFFAGMPKQLSGIRIPKMNVVQWIIAGVFLAIFIFFIRGVADDDLRKASIIWGITALFYGSVFVYIFNGITLMKTGWFIVCVVLAELLAIINAAVVADIGFFGAIFATYLQFVILLPVGAILCGNAEGALEQGNKVGYNQNMWWFQLVVFLVILGYQMLVFLPGDGGSDDGDPIKDMIGSEVDLSDWADM